MTPCEVCERELDLENTHQEADGSTVCLAHCSICRAELDAAIAADDFRYGLLVEVLVVLVLTAWAATAAVAARRGGERLEPRVTAGETSGPVIFTGETGP